MTSTFDPKEKKTGDLIRSEDWNALNTEVTQLGIHKANQTELNALQQNVSALEPLKGALTIEKNSDDDTNKTTVVTVNGNAKFLKNAAISCNGRLHVSGDEYLYLLNKKGVIIGKEWEGSGNLTVQGNTQINGDMSIGTAQLKTKLDVTGAISSNSLSVTGKISSNTLSISGVSEFDGSISSKSWIKARTSVDAGTYVKAGTYVEAGAYVKAGGYIKATGAVYENRNENYVKDFSIEIKSSNFNTPNKIYSISIKKAGPTIPSKIGLNTVTYNLKTDVTTPHHHDVFSFPEKWNEWANVINEQTDGTIVMVCAYDTISVPPPNGTAEKLLTSILARKWDDFVKDASGYVRNSYALLFIKGRSGCFEELSTNNETAVLNKRYYDLLSI